MLALKNHKTMSVQERARAVGMAQSEQNLESPLICILAQYLFIQLQLYETLS